MFVASGWMQYYLRKKAKRISTLEKTTRAVTHHSHRTLKMYLDVWIVRTSLPGLINGKDDDGADGADGGDGGDDHNNENDYDNIININIANKNLIIIKNVIKNYYYYYYYYYITNNYKPCNIFTALLNYRQAIVMSGPISNNTVRLGPEVLFVIGPVCLQFDWLTFFVMTSGEI